MLAELVELVESVELVELGVRLGTVDKNCHPAE